MRALRQGLGARKWAFVSCSWEKVTLQHNDRVEILISFRKLFSTLFLRLVLRQRI